MDIISRILESNIFLIIYFLIYLWDIFFIGALVLKVFRLDIRSTIEKRAYEFALGNLIYAYIFHYLGIFHLLYGQLVLFLYLFPLLFLFKKVVTAKFNFNFRETLNKALSFRVEISELLIFSFLFFVFAPLFLHLFAFPAAWDVLAYHLTLPKVFLQYHYFPFYEWLPNTLMPIGIESLFIFGELVGEPRLANFIVFSFLMMLVIYLVYGLRKLLSNRSLLVLALFLFAFRKTLFTEVAVAPFVDYPVSFYTLLMGTTLIKYIKIPHWRTLLFLVIVSLFTFLTKYALGFVFIFAVFAILAIHAFYNREQFKTMITGMSKFQRIGALLIIAIFLLPVVYWLGRNFIYTHNPISPFFDPFWNKLSPVLGYDKATYEGQMAGLRGSSITFKAIKSAVRSLLIGLPVEYPNFDEALFSLTLSAFPIIALFKKERTMRYLAGFGLLSVLPIYWLAGFPSYRYSLAAAVILAVVTSQTVFGLFRRPFYLLGLPLLAFFVISLSMQLSTTSTYGYNAFKDSFERVSQGFLSYKGAVKNMYGQDNLQNIDYVNTNLNKNTDKILTVFDNRLYYFDVPAEYAVQSIDGLFTNPKTQTIEDIYQRIRQRGITYLFVNNNWGVYGNLRKDLFYPFVETYFQPVSTISGTIVYKLKN